MMRMAMGETAAAVGGPLAWARRACPSTGDKTDWLDSLPQLQGALALTAAAA